MTSGSLGGAALGPLWVDPATWNSSGSIIDIDGLSFSGVPAIGAAEEWIALLRERTARYAAQPYQHLANAYREGGREREARRVLIAQQEDRRHRGLDGSASHRVWRAVRRFGLGIQRVTIGYGYRTWPAFAIALGAAAAGAALGWSAGHTPTHNPHRFALYRPVAPDSAAGRPCNGVQLMMFGVRAPFLADPARSDCALDADSRAGEVYDALFWTMSLVTWASATLAVAGYTGLVRRV